MTGRYVDLRPDTQYVPGGVVGSVGGRGRFPVQRRGVAPVPAQVRVELMNLVAYLRVSTDTQAERGLGLDVQRQGIKAWARSGGHRVVAWFEDAGVSGSNGVEHRVGLHDALAALKDGVAGGIVVYRLDRLARSLTVQEGTLAAVWDLSATVYSVDLGEVPRDDPDDPMRTALRQMVGVFSQLERGVVTARLRAGRKRKAELGGYAYGAPAFGQRSVEGVLVPDASEAAAVHRVRQLHSAGKSLRQIAAALDAEGFRPRRAERWSAEAVRRIVGRLSSP